MKATGIVRRIEACVIIYPRSKTVENQGFPLILSNHINTKICKSRFCLVSRRRGASTLEKESEGKDGHRFRHQHQPYTKPSLEALSESTKGAFPITLSTHYTFYWR